MKLIMKFKDGITVTETFPEDGFRTVGQGNLLELLAKGKANNGDITVTDNATGAVLNRKYSDLYSLEIVLAD